MAYVDLNPVRAKMADTPENSAHTSIKERVKPGFDVERAMLNNPDISAFHLKHFSLKPLAKFEGTVRVTEQAGILFRFKDYLSLVDMTGRIHRNDKRGYIDDALLPILDRLAIDPDDWLENTEKFETVFYRKLYFQNRKDKTA